MIYLLLSTCKRKRYKDNMLNCLSSPVGKILQYRYEKSLLAPTVLENMLTDQKPIGLVCFIDNSKSDAVSIITVREVTIKSISQFGSSVALNLELKDFALTKNGREICSEIASLGCDQLPVGNSSGFLVHKISKYPTQVVIGKSLLHWEKVVDSIFAFDRFKDQKFFYAIPTIYDGTFGEQIRLTDSLKKVNVFQKMVYGIRNWVVWQPLSNINLKQFDAWPDKIRLNKFYTLIIIIYHPVKDDEIKNCRLKFESNFKMHSSLPEDLEIDSLYDIRFYNFKIVQENMTPERNGWLTVNAIEGKGSEIVEWKMALPFSVPKTLSKTISVTICLGLLIAGPAVVNIWKDSVGTDKIYATAIAVVLGYTAALVAVFGIKKIT